MQSEFVQSEQDTCGKKQLMETAASTGFSLSVNNEYTCMPSHLAK